MSSRGGARFVKDPQELPSIASRFDLGKRFPEVPIVGLTGKGWIVPFDDILTSMFGGRLLELSRSFDDRWVEVLAADQNELRWLERLQVLPGFVVDLEDLPGGYRDGLWESPNETQGHQLALVGDVFAIAGSSGKWAMWAQRDWEIGLLVTSDDFVLVESEESPFMRPEEDFEMWRGPAGWTLELTPSMLEEFRAKIRAITG